MNNILNENNVFLNLPSMSKEDAIKLVGEKLLDLGYIQNEYINSMLEREKVMTTFMGMGFAIPHGTNDGKIFVKDTGIVILQFPDGVDFDGEKAYIIIGIAGIGDSHLEILSKIAILIDDELTERLKNCNDKNLFLETFK